MLEEFGDYPLIQLRLGRTPVEAVLVLFLNLASSGKFANKKLELGYDEIYHCRIANNSRAFVHSSEWATRRSARRFSNSRKRIEFD
jgi:hypothetical protein